MNYFTRDNSIGVLISINNRGWSTYFGKTTRDYQGRSRKLATDPELVRLFLEQMDLSPWDRNWNDFLDRARQIVSNDPYLEDRIQNLSIQWVSDTSIFRVVLHENVHPELGIHDVQESVEIFNPNNWEMPNDN